MISKRRNSTGNRPHGTRRWAISSRAKRLIRETSHANPSRPSKLSHPFDEETLVFFDLETTGGNPRNSTIIEIGLLKVKDGKIIDQLETLINPRTYIPKIVTKITGIYPAHVRDAPVIEEVFEDILKFIGDDPVVSHGVQGDIAYLDHYSQKLFSKKFTNYHICTHLLATKIYPQAQQKKLSFLATEMGFQVKADEVHNAFVDAEMTRFLFEKMVPLIKEKRIYSLQDLLLFQGDYSILDKIGPGLNPDTAWDLPQQSGILFLMNSANEIFFIRAMKNLRGEFAGFFQAKENRYINRILATASSFKFERTNSFFDALNSEYSMSKKLLKTEEFTQKKFKNKSFFQFFPDKNWFEAHFPSVSIAGFSIAEKSFFHYGPLVEGPLGFYFGPFDPNDPEVKNHILHLKDEIVFHTSTRKKHFLEKINHVLGFPVQYRDRHSNEKLLRLLLKEKKRTESLPFLLSKSPISGIGILSNNESKIIEILIFVNGIFREKVNVSYDDSKKISQRNFLKSLFAAYSQEVDVAFPMIFDEARVVAINHFYYWLSQKEGEWIAFHEFDTD